LVKSKSYIDYVYISPILNILLYLMLKKLAKVLNNACVIILLQTKLIIIILVKWNKLSINLL